jgi:hypothetical protein
MLHNIRNKSSDTHFSNIPMYMLELKIMYQSTQEVRKTHLQPENNVKYILYE